MIISVDDFKKYVKTTESDEVLSMKLAALELLIRKTTNNNFQKRSVRSAAVIKDGIIHLRTNAPFKVGDTVQVSESKYSDGLYTAAAIDGNIITVKEEAEDEAHALLTKVVYPQDIIMGAVNMLKWDIENRDKVGIQSESLSRHSVTYFNMDGDNSVIGYPKSLTGFLRPYMKARF